MFSVHESWIFKFCFMCSCIILQKCTSNSNTFVNKYQNWCITVSLLSTVEALLKDGEGLSKLFPNRCISKWEVIWHGASVQKSVYRSKNYIYQENRWKYYNTEIRKYIMLLTYDICFFISYINFRNSSHRYLTTLNPVDRLDIVFECGTHNWLSLNIGYLYNTHKW